MPDGMGGGGEGAGGGSQGMGGLDGGNNGRGGYSGFGGVGTDPGVTGTNPQTTNYSGIGSTVGGVLGGFFGPVGSIVGRLAGSLFSGTSSDISGNQTQFNMGGDMATTGSGGGWGQDISSALNIAGGINALTSGGGGGSSTPGDPFSQYRAGLAAQYAGALQPGGATNIEAMPGFTQFQTGVMQPAMQASQRSAAGAGQLYSGGESAALQKIGQQGYSGFMNDYLNRLSTGSGASANPLGGADLAARLQAQQQQAVMQGIGAFGQGISGISNLFGGKSNYSDYSDSSVQAASQQMPSLIPTQQALDPLLWGEG